MLKIGRTTGVTHGRINTLRSFIAFPGTVRRKVLKAWTVVSGNQSTAVCLPGDSGSFVIDEDSAVVGMLWGLRWVGRNTVDFAYLTPFHEITRHIEEVTGYKVRLPQRA